MSHKRSVYPVIMAGGSGTRFWPLSRQLFPKYLLRLVGRDTLIQQTMRRVLRGAPPERVMISTNASQATLIRAQLRQWEHALKDNYVLEADGRNTAPAIARVALELVRRDPEAVMLVVPSDHVIKGQRDFDAAVSLASRLASQGWLVTFGIQPIRPEIGYGYILPSRKTVLVRSKHLKAHPVARFVEKPNSAKAEKYLKSGNYYWNSGIFVWRAQTILEEIQRHHRTLARGIERIQHLMEQQASRGAIDNAYRKLPSVSIDTGVMEKSTKAAVVPVRFRWSDVGSWASLDDLATKDTTANVVSGRVVDVDSQRSIIFADGRVVATIGLSDMIVVGTRDATLVCPKSRSQEVKKVVEILKQQGAPERLDHPTVHRPWGSYNVIEEGPAYKVKRLTVDPGERLSLQMHRERSEHWVVVAGTARVTRGDEVFDLQIGSYTAVPVGTPHRIENPGEDPLQIIEVQNGRYLGEDDVVRLADDYGRAAHR